MSTFTAYLLGVATPLALGAIVVLFAWYLAERRYQARTAAAVSHRKVVTPVIHQIEPTRARRSW